MAKIAATVILYYPDQHTYTNILSYIDQVEILYVLDNSEISYREMIEMLLPKSKVQYIHDGVNKGIAFRLNQAALLAIQAGFDLLLTMDQDSSFEKEVLVTYFNCIENSAGKNKVAMYGLQSEGKDNSILSCASHEATQLITSGSVVNLSIYKEINGFDENLFIDGVDLEYCYRSILAGFSIIKLDHLYLHHKLGNISYHRSLKNFKLTSRTFHSPIRIYYMVRNYLYLKSKYQHYFKDEMKIQRKDLGIRIKNNLLYGNNRFPLLKYIYKAFIDYKKNNMGKILVSAKEMSSVH